MQLSQDTRNKPKKFSQRGLPRVKVTIEHVERALRSIAEDPWDLGNEDALIAGGILAHMDKLHDRTVRTYYLAAIAVDDLEWYLIDYIKSHYGLDQTSERCSCERTDKRNGKDPVFETALAERLAALRASIENPAS